jgi:hypothetical protein
MTVLDLLLGRPLASDEQTCPNQQVAVLKGLLLLKGNQRIIVINVLWYLES